MARNRETSARSWSRLVRQIRAERSGPRSAHQTDSAELLERPRVPLGRR